jgi:hypothetical protein
MVFAPATRIGPDSASVVTSGILEIVGFFALIGGLVRWLFVRGSGFNAPQFSALIAVVLTFLLAVIGFSGIRANFEPDTFGFWALTAMCVVAIGAQFYFLASIATRWESLSSSERGSLAMKGIFLPPLLALGSFVTLAIGVIALAVWLLAIVAQDDGVKNNLGNYKAWVK